MQNAGKHRHAGKYRHWHPPIEIIAPGEVDPAQENDQRAGLPQRSAGIAQQKLQRIGRLTRKFHL